MRDIRPWMTEKRRSMGLSMGQMAKRCKCSPGLLRAIEYEGFVTHPKIAARIAAAYAMGLDGYNDLVPDDRRATELPKPQDPPKFCEMLDI